MFEVWTTIEPVSIPVEVDTSDVDNDALTVYRCGKGPEQDGVCSHSWNYYLMETVLKHLEYCPLCF